jgi:H+/Cl- antiporter ClcA
VFAILQLPDIAKISAVLRARVYQQRAFFLVGGVLVGLVSVAFAQLGDVAQNFFAGTVQRFPWAVWIMPPLGFAISAYLAKRWLPHSAGSGIPQSIAALQTHKLSIRHTLLSGKIAIGKIALTLLGLACGASIGREGPTVQVGASIMLAFGGIMHRQQRGLILAGASAGIAAAFNAPLAGVVFAIEELSRSFESRTSGLILTATILAGLTATQLSGNYTYFGTSSGSVATFYDWVALLVVSVTGGALGGLFSRLVVAANLNPNVRSMLRRDRHPAVFALLCGVGISLCGYLSMGATFGTGYEQAFSILQEHKATSWMFVVLKMIATGLSSISGIPGGLFSPSLAVGAGLGSVVSQFVPVIGSTQVELLGMAAYLTGVVQAPITSVVIMAEMTDNNGMVVPLLVCALIADFISKRIQPVSIYHALAAPYVRD